MDSIVFVGTPPAEVEACLPPDCPSDFSLPLAVLRLNTFDLVVNGPLGDVKLAAVGTGSIEVVVPEPAPFQLVALGLLGIACSRRFRRSQPVRAR
jgi:hypothetical protein